MYTILILLLSYHAVSVNSYSSSSYTATIGDCKVINGMVYDGDIRRPLTSSEMSLLINHERLTKDWGETMAKGMRAHFIRLMMDNEAMAHAIVQSSFSGEPYAPRTIGPVGPSFRAMPSLPCFCQRVSCTHSYTSYSSSSGSINPSSTYSKHYSPSAYRSLERPNVKHSSIHQADSKTHTNSRPVFKHGQVVYPDPLESGSSWEDLDNERDPVQDFIGRSLANARPSVVKVSRGPGSSYSSSYSYVSSGGTGK